MIEIYFETLTGKAEEKICTTPLVKSLSGVIELPEDFDFKNARTKHLLEKHK